LQQEGAILRLGGSFKEILELKAEELPEGTFATYYDSEHGRSLKFTSRLVMKVRDIEGNEHILTDKKLSTDSANVEEVDIRTLISRDAFSPIENCDGYIYSKQALKWGEYLDLPENLDAQARLLLPTLARTLAWSSEVISSESARVSDVVIEAVKSMTILCYKDNSVIKELSKAQGETLAGYLNSGNRNSGFSVVYFRNQFWKVEEIFKGSQTGLTIRVKDIRGNAYTFAEKVPPQASSDASVIQEPDLTNIVKSVNVLWNIGYFGEDAFTEPD
ncbi:MAG: hypothetical protein NTZ48_06445, partial [Candidatus Omnitrophica bacterium]|nr:hypothetical protein [Candidatus Omnitrophota bacterium]